mmetsp:Transcript_13685/g.2185  ORF Transcript_13685/g.2185 Transcript_13685/m.2185 type:complete len:101 (+) Transcript_13685:4714-5016(+)
MIRTMVEVNDSTGQIPFTLTPSSSIKVSAGTTSLPIRVHTSYAPNIDVKLQLAFSDTTLGEKITVNTTELNFIPDKNNAYFAISVLSTYNISVDPTSVKL